MAAVSLSSLLFMSLLKNSFRRSRPDNPLVDGITNFSFPSGHAFMSAAFTACSSGGPQPILKMDGNGGWLFFF